MKRLICLLLVLIMLLGLTACGEYTEGSTATRETYVEIPPDSVDPEDELTSSVTLMVNGMPIDQNPAFYVLYLEMEIYAQWYDGHTMVVSKFDEKGVALATGLDGDFAVTLSDVPGDYTYNINGHTTDNDNRRIEIDVYRILYGEGPGTDYMYPYVREFSDTGVYEITIDSPDQVIMCRFAPGISGIYTIESWVDVADDNVNPKYDYWYGSVAAAWYHHTVDDGGACGVYTKNFKDVRTISDEEIGNVFIFGVHASAKDGQYPIKVQVAVLRTGDFGDRYEKEVMLPEEELRQVPEHPDATLEYFWTRENGSIRLDASKCKLWRKEDGGDGYYHIYDEVVYAATNGWGPTLYAQISANTIMGYALNTLEWQGNGNNMLTIGSTLSKLYDYKQFIEGFESLATEHGGNFVGSCFCVKDCKCHKATDKILACQEFCENCLSICTQAKPEEYGTPGYADAVNSDGVYPVTEELQKFLQLFAESHNLFCDGTGAAEDKGLTSDQKSMWLWAVVYYSDDNGGACQLGSLIPNYFDK